MPLPGLPAGPVHQERPLQKAAASMHRASPTGGTWVSCGVTGP